MEEIRCPMCGTPNPEDREVCHVCQARLKPLVPDQIQDGFPINESDDFPSLQGQQTEEGSSTTSQEAGEENEALQWLRDLRPRQAEKDWINDAQDEETTTPEETEDQDRLTRLRQRPTSPTGTGSLPAEWSFEFQIESKLEPISWVEQTDKESAQSEPLPSISATPEGEEAKAAEEIPLPDWLGKLPEEASPSISADKTESLQPSQEILSEEMPVTRPPTGSDEAIAERLSAPTLPSWVEAMRPAETPSPLSSISESFDQVENAGPLAGLRGVLPAEPEIARPRKRAVFPPPLQISEKQRSHIELLQAILATSEEFHPPTRAKIIRSAPALRIFIATILLVVLLIPIIFASQITPLPTNLPEVLEVSRLIAGLPDQSRVLVAFDYEPGLSAEMDAAASAVLDHLMLRGAYLTLLSTTPDGPILAERFVTTIQASHHYRSGQEYLNLGYIPGGISGLSALVANPQRSLPYTLQGYPAWEGSFPLQSITSLSDFSLVVVIADQPDGARAWIEQVQPILGAGKVPLVMVVSAQAEPLVRPYYEANPRQVAGLVIGLRGGAAYARLTGRGGLARMYWDAFSIGLPLAGFILLLSGFVQVFLHGRAQGTPSGKEQAL